jgi:hypothetical protein
VNLQQTTQLLLANLKLYPFQLLYYGDSSTNNDEALADYITQ